MRRVALSGLKQSAGPLRLVRRVGVFLRLKADGGMLLIFDAFLARHAAIEEIAGVDLDAGLVGEDLQHDARQGRVDAGCQLLVVALAVVVAFQAPIVVYAVAILDGGDGEVVHHLANLRGLQETHRRVLHPFLLSRCHEGGIGWCVVIGVQVELMILDVLRRIAVQVEVRVVGHVQHRWLVSLAEVADVKAIVVFHLLRHRDFHRTGEAVVAIVRYKGEHQR